MQPWLVKDEAPDRLVAQLGRVETAVVDKIELSEYQHAKDLIKVGEVVKVRAHGMSPFSATVRRIVQLSSGAIEVEVIDPRYRHFRTVTPDRVTVPKAKKRTVV